MTASCPGTGSGARRALGWRGIGPMLILAVLAPLGLLILPRGSQVAVIGRPGASPSELANLVAAAGGGLIRGGGYANIAIAASDEAGFTTRLYRAGAWIVLDPIVAGGCTRTLDR